MALSPAQVYSAAVGAGFSPAQAVTMTAIAGAESGFNPNAHNPVPPDDSYGLWQINMLGSLGPARRSAFGISSNAALYDPATNARAAKQVFDGQGLRAWSTYSSGAYLKYLPQAQAAASGGTVAVPTSSGGSPAPSSGSGGPVPTLGPNYLPWNWPADLANGAIGAGQQAAGTASSNLLSQVGNLLFRGAFIALGIALIGVGVVKGLTSYTTGRVQEATQSLPPVIPV